ncbi:hypothetical protein ABC347_11055 [Sphingomonas sp. 1P06PA]|uniref:hypothetical protein n=1 Tax=Sphingomonas sp. 1P06PA TaxID=554121 RepID=UPI0039A5477C
MDARYETAGEAFSTWLVNQTDAKAWYSDLAKAAKADRALPRYADPETVRTRLQSMGAEPDMFEMLDDAERAWIADCAPPINEYHAARA